jgi:tetratricopeptide (TPR) repeat protein
MPRVPFATAAFAFALLCAPVAAVAHPEIADALDRLATQLAAAPNDAALYLERGELYAKYGEWVPAEANYLRAAELSPHLPRLALARGALALSTQNLTEARRFLDQALAAAPDDAEAHILRARTLARLNQRPAAIADYDRALRVLAEPPPDLFLERALLYAAPADALRSLEEGSARLGPVITLQLHALDLEISLGRIEAALVRIDALAASSERRETWLKRRGDLLSSVGRIAEARAAYAAAAAAIAGLPTWIAQSPDTARLSAELARLAATTTP